jgi:hypothetical protein
VMMSAQAMLCGGLARDGFPVVAPSLVPVTFGSC